MNLNQVTVASSNVAESITFYSSIGLKLIVEDLPKYARFECPQGDSTFSVHLAEGAVLASQAVVYFECEDLDQKVLALSRLGITFTSPPTDEPWLWREARLQDPDGNRICLFYAGKNRHHPPWRLG